MLKYYDELDRKNELKVYLPFLHEKESFFLPDCYYINPYGLLYNCFGSDGHKGANLIYTYSDIKDSFNEKKYTTLEGLKIISLKKILKNEIENYNRIIRTHAITESDTMSYIHMDFFDLKDPLIFDLVLGIVTSKIILLKKFIELQNKSNNKIEDLKKIILLSNDDINDILVMYCGFHKIESQQEKTITTSSLNIYDFYNYLENGWTIDIISPISINQENEEDLLFNTLVVDRYLEKNPKHNGRIRIKKFNFDKRNDIK